MSGDGLTDESTYLRTRGEQLVKALGRSHGISRRRLLGMLAAGVPIVAGIGRLGGNSSVQSDELPILKPLPPEWFDVHGSNAEMRWDAMRDQGLLVPSERFFVRNHTATPRIDPSTWRLRVFGSGLRGGAPVEFSYEDLLAMRARNRTEVLECAGNGRRFFGDQQGTPTDGTQWGLGAVGAARWRGVPLAEVLDRAGVTPGAVDVLPEGLDQIVVEDGVNHGHVRRPLPIDKALDDVLVAYEMNGEPLLADHGAPVRLIVPGWVGIASIKWLGQIEVANEPLFSPWNTDWYRMIGGDYPPDSPPLTEQPVKSAFELAWNAQIPLNEPTTLQGRSWSGTAPINQVEVSVDYGHNWRRAQLDASDARAPWTRWEVPWTPRRPGVYELLARATDESGLAQPDQVPFNDGGYQFWAVVRHPVTVGSG